MDKLSQPFLEVQVSETDETRGYWLDQPTSPPGARPMLLSAHILLVPDLGDEAAGPSFPAGTQEFIERLRELLGSEITVAVAISPDDYEEISLHGKAWRIPKFVIGSVALPILLGILTNRLDELLPGHKPNDVAEATIIVEAPNRRTLKLSYKGPPDGLAEFVGRQAAFLARIDPEASQPEDVSDVLDEIEAELLGEGR